MSIATNAILNEFNIYLDASSNMVISNTRSGEIKMINTGSTMMSYDGYVLTFIRHRCDCVVVTITIPTNKCIGVDTDAGLNTMTLLLPNDFGVIRKDGICYLRNGLEMWADEQCRIADHERLIGKMVYRPVEADIAHGLSTISTTIADYVLKDGVIKTIHLAKTFGIDLEKNRRYPDIYKHISESIPIYFRSVLAEADYLEHSLGYLYNRKGDGSE